jgi:hypothetical protein
MTDHIFVFRCPAVDEGGGFRLASGRCRTYGIFENPVVALEILEYDSLPSLEHAVRAAC